MKTYKVMAAGLLAVSIAMPSMALAAPFDWKIIHRDGGDTTDVNQSISPPTLLNGTQYIPLFDDTNEIYKFVAVGSGINYSYGSGLISVTPFSIETTDGHLSDTLGLMQGNIANLTSSVGALSVPDLSSINAKLAEVNSNLYGTSTSMSIATASTTNGLMSKADKTKLDSLSTTSPLKAYEGTTLRTGAFPIFKSATVASGVATFNLTADGTSGGTALCTGGVIQDSVNVTFNDNASSYQQSWAFTNSNKTLTVTANKFTSANILSGLLGQAAANGSVAKVSVYCYA